MRIDLYTKIILTLVAVLLAVMVLKPILQPQAAMADGPYGGVQFSYSGGNHRSSIPAVATCGNMATMASLNSTTKSMNWVRITIAITVKRNGGRKPHAPGQSRSRLCLTCL